MACDSSLASHTGVAEKKAQFFHRGLLRRKDAVLNDPMSTQPETASLVAEMIKNLPAMQETWVRSLSWEDPLEEGMATHCSILAWRIPGQRSMMDFSPWGRKAFVTTEQLTV